MKRKVTIELTVQQASAVHDLICFGMWEVDTWASKKLFNSRKQATGKRGYRKVKAAFQEAFGERLHDTP